MKKQKTKRMFASILSIILVFQLLLGEVPMTVLAQNPGGNVSAGMTDPLASSGEKKSDGEESEQEASQPVEIADTAIDHMLTGVAWTDADAVIHPVEGADGIYDLSTLKLEELQSLELHFQTACILHEDVRIHAGDWYYVTVPSALIPSADAQGSVLVNKGTESETEVAAYTVEEGKIKVTFQDAVGAAEFDAAQTAEYSVSFSVDMAALSGENTTTIDVAAQPDDAMAQMILPVNAETPAANSGHADGEQVQMISEDAPDGSAANNADDAGAQLAVHPGDISGESGQLYYALNDLQYKDRHGAYHNIEKVEDSYNLTGVTYEDIAALRLGVGFHILKDDETREIVAGDYFTMKIPEEFVVPDGTTGIINFNGITIADYVVNKDSQGKNILTATFSDAVNYENGYAMITGMLYVDVSLDADKFSYSDQVSIEVSGQPGTTSSQIIIPHKSNTVNGVEKTGVYDPETRTVTWTIQVGTETEGINLTGLTLKDTFPTMQQNLAAVYLGGKDGTDITNRVTPSAEGDNTSFSYTFQAEDQAKTPQTLTVVTQVKDEFMPVKTGKDVTNEAEVSAPKDSPIQVGDNNHDNAAQTIDPVGITKNGEQIDANRIRWTIVVNENEAAHIWDAIVSDTLDATLILDPNTVRVNDVPIQVTEPSAIPETRTEIIASSSKASADDPTDFQIYFPTDRALSGMQTIIFETTTGTGISKEDVQVKNVADITWRWPDWTGTGPNWVPIKLESPEISTTFNTAAIVKSCTDTDERTGVISWSMVPSTREDTWEEATIIDVIGTPTAYDENGYATAYAKDQTLNAGSIRVKKGNTVIGQMNEDGTQATFIEGYDKCSIKIENETGGSDPLSKIVVKLDADQILAGDSSLSDYSIEYKTTAIDYFNENYQAHSYKDQAQIEVAEGTTVYRSKGNASTVLENKFLSKNTKYEWDNNTGKMHYTLTVNANKLALDGFTIKDNLSGTAYTSDGWNLPALTTAVTYISPEERTDSIPAEEWVFDINSVLVKNSTGDDVTSEFKKNIDDRILTVSTDKKVDDTYTIDIYLTLSDKAKASYLVAGDCVIATSNSADGQSASLNNGEPFAPVTSVGTGEGEIRDKLVEKTGDLEAATETTPLTIDWTVRINPAGGILKGHSIKDTLPTSVTLDPTSVHLYEAVHNSDGSISATAHGQEVQSVAVTYDMTENGEMVMTIALPDGKNSYVLEYKTEVTSKTDSVSNDVEFDQGSIQLSGSTETVDTSDANWGFLTTMIRLRLLKHDSLAGNSMTLSGARYALYAADPGDGESDAVPAIKQAYTNQYGQVVFYGLTKDTTYYYKEKAAPEGYQLDTTSYEIRTDEEQSITVAASDTTANDRTTGAAAVKKNYENPAAMGTEAYETVFTLDVIPDAATGKKVAVYGNEVSGNTYTYDAGTTTGISPDPTATKEFTLTGDGEELSWNDLPWGDYEVTEYSTQAGYKCYQGTEQFSIDKDGKVSYKFTQDPTANEVANLHTDMTIQKLVEGQKAELLSAGTVLSIYDSTGTTIVNHPIENTPYTFLCTATESVFTVDALPAGSYILKETTGPQNQKVGMAADIPFTMDKYGQVTVNGKAAEDNVVKMNDLLTTVTLNKQDQFGAVVNGAVIELQKNKGTKADPVWETLQEGTWTVGSTDDEKHPGRRTFNIDRDSSYRFVETTMPDGYLTTNVVDPAALSTGIQNVIEFKTDIYGKVITDGDDAFDLNRIAQNQPDAYANTADAGNNTFTMRNERIMGQAQFTKQDVTPGAVESTKGTLSGVKYDLYKVGSGEKDKKINSKPLTSDANGLVSTRNAGNDITNIETGLALNKGLTPGTYYFQEIEAHIDFILPSGEAAKTATFEVKADGSNRYTWKSGDQITYEEILGVTDTATGTATKNTALHAMVKLVKTDADGVTGAVTGAGYRLEGEDANGNHVTMDATTVAANTVLTYTDSNGNEYTYTTITDGEACFLNVPRSGVDGYTVRETTAAPGYTVSEATYSTGQIDSGTATIDLNADGKKITDTQTTFTIDKRDAAGMALTGSTFTVTGTFKDGTTSKTMLDGAATDTLTGQMIAGNQYTVEETTVPAGATALAEFTVICGEDGKFTLERGDNTEEDLTYVHDSAGNTNTVTAVNHITIQGTKKWTDSSNAYGTRPDAGDYIPTVKLYKNYTDGGTAKQEVTGAKFEWTTTGDTWTYTISNISPAGADAYYTVEETVPTGYTEAAGGAAGVSETDDGKLAAATLSNELKVTSLTANKVWGEGSVSIAAEVLGIRVKVQRSSDQGNSWNDVSRNGTVLMADIYKAADQNTHTWSDLPLTVQSGDGTGVYSYRAVETHLLLANGSEQTVQPGLDETSGTAGGYLYTSTTADQVTTITNIQNNKVLTASKIWDDMDNQDGKHPAEITFHLWQDGAQLDGSYDRTLSAYEGWTKVTWEGLPAQHANGVKITYQVSEESVSEYTTKYLPASIQLTELTQNIEVTNAYTPETIDITADKIWADNNAYGDRPENIKLTLWAQSAEGGVPFRAVAQDGTTLPEVTLSADTTPAWAYSWSNLPKYKVGAAGEILIYSVRETTPDGETSLYGYSDPA